MTTPLHYIFQAAMGQCSTLPTENNGKQEATPTQMTPSSHSSRRSYRQQREERDTYGRDVDEGRRQSDGDVVYFNHSFAYNGPNEFISAYSRVSDTNKIVAIISRGSVVGIQFHPEKSQEPGLKLLSRLIVEG